MLLSRFWYVILAILAIVGVMAAMVASNVVNEQRTDLVTRVLTRDHTVLEQALEIEARARLDALAPFAANRDVRSALRQASARAPGAAVPEPVAAGLAAKIAELNGQLADMRGDLLFAVDDEGWIVSAVAPGRIPAGAGIGEFPLVARALEGYVRDDVWVYNDDIYRMAARPVIDGGQYVGAIIHGKRADEGFAERLSTTRLPGATIAFFIGPDVKAGHMASGDAPRTEELGGELLTRMLADPEVQSGERAAVQQLPGGGLAVYSLVHGTAREANVGYAIARPVPRLEKPWDLVLSTPTAEWLEVAKLWPVWAIFAVLILVAMFCVWLERDRPLGKMRRAASLLGSPESRLTVTDFGGQYRKIAQHVNDALDRTAGEVGPKRQAAKNLDEILGPAPDAQQPAFFGFAQQDGPPPAFGDLPPVPPAEPAPTPPAAAKPPPPKPPAPPSAKPAAPPAAKPTPPAPEATAPAPVPPPSKVTAPGADPTKPSPVQRKQLKRTLLGVPPPAEDDDEDEGATMVARVPEELLAQSASHALGGDDEDKHFREVYQQFLDTKKQCGEPTAGLTFDKFVVTLRKNRDQIVNRHGARKVRFTVYVKEGKAALKATPIRD